jgi:uncharacterized membrane protein YbaN (DUF454 family)
LVGLFSLALGGLGALVPVLPTFPFLLLAASCLGASSPQLYARFTASSLYRNSLQSYLQGKGMRAKVKARVLICLSLVMGTALWLLRRSHVSVWILGIVWFGHVIYFLFGVKTLAGVLFGLSIGNDVLFFCFFATGMPLGMNTVIFPEAYGGNPKTGASMALVSHTLCVLSIPLLYALMVFLFGLPFAG